MLEELHVAAAGTRRAITTMPKMAMTRFAQQRSACVKYTPFLSTLIARMKATTALLFLVPSTLAFQIQFPFKVPQFFASKILQTVTEAIEEVAPVSTTPRIAIIGAGAGGSSAAFWISKAKERFGLEVEVDIYDSNDYIGGRE